MLASAAESTNDASTYIYDATRRALPLLCGQSGHDWAYLLGPNVFDALQHTDAIAYTTRAGSALLFARLQKSTDARIPRTSSCTTSSLRGTR